MYDAGRSELKDPRFAAALARPVSVTSGNRPVRRIDDQRGAPRTNDVRTLVHPEVVVTTHVATGLGTPGLSVPQAGGTVDGALLALRRFLLGQECLVAKVFGTLERRDGPKIPDTLQVRRAPGGLRHILRHGQRWPRHQHHERPAQRPQCRSSTCHRNLPSHESFIVATIAQGDGGHVPSCCQHGNRLAISACRNAPVRRPAVSAHPRRHRSAGLSASMSFQ